MATVTMTHPDLPEQRIVVDELSVPHHQAAGWQITEDLPQEPTSPARSRRHTTRKDSD
ncbi:hypothetical protein [Streptomyces sp. NPDC048584]|uniref:hypothetical protein n=1 Tax=Streptomyces sp. NPDC048584 TaxID=3365573 RepID=UPI003723E367